MNVIQSQSGENIEHSVNEEESVDSSNNSLTKLEWKTLDRLVCSDDIVELKNHLSNPEFIQSLNENLFEIIQWVCNSLSKLDLSKPVKQILLEFLTDLTSLCDPAEYMLLLTGQLRTTIDLPHSEPLLKPLAICIVSSALHRFARIKPVINSLTQLVTSFSQDMLDSPQSCSIDAVVDFYSTILTHHTFPPVEDAFVLQHLFFLLSRPLLIVAVVSSDLPQSHVPTILHYIARSRPHLFRYALQTLQLESIEHGDTVQENTFPLCLYVPAWLRILACILLEPKPSNIDYSWPLVHTVEFYLDTFQSLWNSILDVELRSKFISDSTSDDTNICFQPMSESMYTTVQVYSITLFQKLVSSMRLPLTSHWWSASRVAYLNHLKIVATQPISESDMPKVLTTAVSSAGWLVSKSTYSARYNLLSTLLDPNQTPVHHGWRGHVITLCKDYVHNAWIDCLANGLPSILTKEREVGEIEISVPVFKQKMGCLCELIFIYPHPASSDSLLDQSSWLLSALNFAWYILIRCKNAMTSEKCSDVNANDLLQGLVRPSQCGSSFSFLEKFLKPLEEVLHGEINQYQSRAHGWEISLQNGCSDTATENRLHSELNVENSKLLRLRLLHSTTEQVRKSTDEILALPSVSHSTA